MGKCYARLNQLDRAETCLRKSTKLAPELADGWYQLGLVLKRQGKPLDAAGAFERSSKGEQSQLELVSTAYELEQLGLRKRAHDLYQNGLSLDSSEADVLLSLPEQ